MPYPSADYSPTNSLSPSISLTLSPSFFHLSKESDNTHLQDPLAITVELLPNPTNLLELAPPSPLCGSRRQPHLHCRLPAKLHHHRLSPCSHLSRNLALQLLLFTMSTASVSQVQHLLHPQSSINHLTFHFSSHEAPSHKTLSAVTFT